jgi:hypothetical protein
MLQQLLLLQHHSFQPLQVLLQASQSSRHNVRAAVSISTAAAAAAGCTAWSCGTAAAAAHEATLAEGIDTSSKVLQLCCAEGLHKSHQHSLLQLLHTLLRCQDTVPAAATAAGGGGGVDVHKTLQTVLCQQQKQRQLLHAHQLHTRSSNASEGLKGLQHTLL